MANRHVADEVVQDFRIKNLGDEAHAVVLEKFAFVAGNDAGAFLSAMLQRVKTVVGKLGSIRMTENAEHAAIMFGVVLHRITSLALAPAAELSQTKTRCASRELNPVFCRARERGRSLARHGTVME
jgi:hypothetical protein